MPNTEEKTCARCKESKPVSNYHILKTGKPYSYCRLCMCARSREWTAKNRFKSRTSKTKYRQNNREKVNKSSLDWHRANMTPKKVRIRNKKTYARSPLKNKAHRAVRDGYRNKTLTRQPCVVCQKSGVSKIGEAHHSDYSKPLDVTFLCLAHHRAWHRVFEASV